MFRAVRDWGHFVTKVSPFYKPKVFQSNTQLQRFLSGSKPIHNRSFRTLNDVEIEALALGLGFIPTTTTTTQQKPTGVRKHVAIARLDLTKETKRLIKAINTTIHFALQPQQIECDDDVVVLKEKNSNSSSSSRSRSSSSTKRLYGSLAKIVTNPWQPPQQEWLMEPQIHHALGQLASGFGFDYPQSKNVDETAPEILEALDNLLSDPDILVCAADKGGTIVIWRTAEYEREALYQLSDRSTYAPVSKKKDDDFNAIIVDGLLLERKRLARRLLNLNCLSAHEYGAVIDAPAEPAAFYMKPKLHKAINRETATFHGRPIASTCKSAPRMLDKYLANITSPLLPLIPGSLTDTTHLLQELVTYNSNGNSPLCVEKQKKENSINSNSRVVTADVNALYPSIPWEEGVNAAVQFYTKHYAWLRSEMRDERGLLPPPPPDLFGEILWFIVSNSFVSFKQFGHSQKKNGGRKSQQQQKQQPLLLFHQTKGTAMGCCVSVFLANCFMWSVTRNVIERPPGHLDFFLRYIDDLLFLTRGTDADICNLISSITTQAIKYTVGEKLGSRVEFLDVAIEIDAETKRIETFPFQKATASPFYLHARSMHPKHTIESLPYAQLIRLKRICSSQNTFVDAAVKLLDKFRARGYKMHILNRAFFRALAVPRNQLLQRKQVLQLHGVVVATLAPSIEYEQMRRNGKTSKAAVRNFNYDTLKFIPTFDKSHDWQKTRKTLDKIKRFTTRYYHGTRAAEALAAKQTALIFKRARNVGASFLNKSKNVYNYLLRA